MRRNIKADPLRRRISEEVDSICDRFEAAWEANQEPRLEDYLAEAADRSSIYDQLLTQLLLAEWDLRSAKGNAIAVSEYIERFHDGKLINAAFDQWKLQQGEHPNYAAMDNTGRPVTLTPPSGPHIRCPHCHELVELDHMSSFSDVVCDACDNRFSLTGSDKATRDADTLKTFAHFELVEHLGTGAFGSVWKARDTQLDRTVAIKIPRKGQLEPREVEKFLREARAVAQLRHPNILNVHEVGRDGNTVYIVSDLVRGVTLDDWLSGQMLGVREAAGLCSKLASALHHAHENGVIHRDLKPQNVMLDEGHEPHLMDFGLAKREAGEMTVTMDGHVLGTPAYMSPEQAKGEAHEADRRTDVYSLGVILFQSLTGELPFRGNPRMLIHQVIHEEPPSPRKLNANVPKDLETICLRCLEKEPVKRFVTAEDVAEDLDRFLRGEPIRARSISPTARAWRWCKRNRAVTSLTAVVVLVLLLGTGVAIWQAHIVGQQSHRADAEAIRYRRLLYISDMDSAAKAWDTGNIDRLGSLLKRHLPVMGQDDLRGFAWYHLFGLARDSLSTPTWQNEVSVTSLAFSRRNDVGARIKEW